jgi:hypothetical protein
MRGATFPLQNGQDGLIETSDDDRVLMRSALRQYLLGTRGARVMRPTWGASTDDLLFDPNDDVSAQVFRTRAYEAQKFLPLVIDDVEFLSVAGRPDAMAPVVYFHVAGDEASEDNINFANATTSETGGTP